MFSKSSLIILVIFLLSGFLLAKKLLPDNQQEFNKEESFYKVGLIKILDHPALDATENGFLTSFKEKTPQSQIFTESAQADLNIANQIIQKFIQQKVDVIITLGTTVSQIAMKKTKKIPIVFASVTDPLTSGLVESLDRPGGNITGMSNFTPTLIEKSLYSFKKILPNLKKLGIIYNPGEANSVLLLTKTTEVAGALGIEIKSLAAQNTNEAVFAAQNLAGSVDAFFINNDNTALAAIGGIVQAAGKVPVFSSDLDTFDQGVLAAFGPDQYKIGEEVATLALSLLNQEAFPATTAVIFPEETQLLINKKVVNKLGLTLDFDLVDNLK